MQYTCLKCGTKFVFFSIKFTFSMYNFPETTYSFTAPTYTTARITFSISYPAFKKIPYFVDPTLRGGRGWKEAQRQGQDKVTLRKTLLPRWYRQDDWYTYHQQNIGFYLYKFHVWIFFEKKFGIILLYFVLKISTSNNF
jgi:hypothetical protein